MKTSAKHFGLTVAP